MTTKDNFSPRWSHMMKSQVFQIFLLVTCSLVLLCLFYPFICGGGKATSSANFPLVAGDLRRRENSLFLGIVAASPSVRRRFGLETDGGEKVEQEADDIAVTRQEDLFISVKTSKKFHRERLEVILKTWYQLARDQVWFFTDERDQDIDSKSSKANTCDTELTLFAVGEKITAVCMSMPSCIGIVKKTASVPA